MTSEDHDPTSFDRYFAAQMKDPEAAAAYQRERAIIDSVDALVRRLDAAGALAGVDKAELARRVTPLVELAAGVGLHLELVPNRMTAALLSDGRPAT